MKFLKKNLKYEISEGANLFESKRSIDAYLSAFTALRKEYQIARSSAFSG